MGNANSPSDDKSTPATSAERRLRGDALDGSEQKNAVDHAKYEKTRRPDTELRLDGEEDTLYDDGLDVSKDDSILWQAHGDLLRGSSPNSSAWRAWGLQRVAGVAGVRGRGRRGACKRHAVV